MDIKITNTETSYPRKGYTRQIIYFTVNGVCPRATINWESEFGVIPMKHTIEEIESFINENPHRLDEGFYMK